MSVSMDIVSILITNRASCLNFIWFYSPFEILHQMFSHNRSILLSSSAPLYWTLSSLFLCFSLLSQWYIFICFSKRSVFLSESASIFEEEYWLPLDYFICWCCYRNIPAECQHCSCVFVFPSAPWEPVAWIDHFCCCCCSKVFYLLISPCWTYLLSLKWMLPDRR